MSSPELVFSMDVGNTGTDVEVCNGVVAVAIEGAPTKQDNGTVVFHQGWSAEPGRGGMPELYEVTTMALPDMIHFSNDCSVMVIANEGEAGITNGSFVNPPGGVTVLKWVNGDVSQPPTVQHLDFSAFSGEELYNADGTGVLWSYRPDNSVAGEDSFAQDLEPEYVAITEDASMAYVILQENNAVAFVSLGETPKVEAIAPLGLKDWSSLTMDASNVDGKVNMASYPIWGAYQPDTIQTFSSGGKQYLVTANEGDSKEYLVDNPDETEFWIEEVRGADIANFGPDVSQEMRDMLADESQLGRLKFLSRHGLDENGMMAKFITMGGRSVTIFEMTDDFRAVKVWDSGDEIERKHAEMDPDGARGLFNPEQEGGFIAAGFDQRSDDKGVETETVALGMCGGAHLLFVGNERSSALTIYDITDPAAPVMLEQVPLANPTGQGNTTWEALHAERALGVIDPESMKYVAMDDTNGHLMVAGAVSGTLSTLKISCEDGGSAPSQDSGAGLSALTAPISLLLSTLLALMLVLNEPRF
eukprot:CAMPEP_0177764400 /NCGR_PEP_ID=MMETSP0491_2-20121128/7383_1 /TAXON_ID=63592 /ORGANISM="Tetraselmis chuii, Strain PLY429" /LENGTH=529 /DNA_ID=CAMNT_0019280569 /DNA_START=1180 /DNA_END=2769 /DNA_ORIENTATION=-